MKTNSNVTRIIYVFLFISVITACKKDEKSDGTTAKQWKVGSKTYTQAIGMSQDMGEAIAVTGYASMPSGSATIDRFTAYFKTKPTASGTYKIVYKPNFSDLLADEVYVDAAEATGDKLAVAKGEGKVAKITVSGGKVSVTVPSVSAYYGPRNGSMNETTTLEGNVVEN